MAQLEIAERLNENERDNIFEKAWPLEERCKLEHENESNSVEQLANYAQEELKSWIEAGKFPTTLTPTWTADWEKRVNARVGSCQAVKLRRHREQYYLDRPLNTELETLMINSSLARKRHLYAELLTDSGLTTQRMKALKQSVLWSALGDAGINSAEERVEIIAALQQQVDVIFLQGSASYLAIFLQLNGLLVKKIDFMKRIALAFDSWAIDLLDADAGCYERNLKRDTKIRGNLRYFRDSGLPPFCVNMKNLANALFGSVCLNSSAAQSVNLISKREFRGADKKPINTQLWQGYARKNAEKWFAVNPGATAAYHFTVDIGSGELKYFACRCTRKANDGKPTVEAIATAKRESDGPERYNAKLRELFNTLKLRQSSPEDSLQAAQQQAAQVARELIGITVEGEEWPGSIFTESTMTTEAGKKMSGKDATQLRTKLLSIAGVKSWPINFVGTSFTRGQMHKHGWEVFNKGIELVCDEMENLAPHINPGEVKFVTLQQEDESRLELESAEWAFEHAVDLPPDCKGNLGGNLSWGNGSLQGTCKGIGNEPDRHYSLPNGLKSVEEMIRTACQSDNLKDYVRIETVDIRGKPAKVLNFQNCPPDEQWQGDEKFRFLVSQVVQMLHDLVDKDSSPTTLKLCNLPPKGGGDKVAADVDDTHDDSVGRSFSTKTVLSSATSRRGSISEKQGLYI